MVRQHSHLEVFAGDQRLKRSKQIEMNCIHLWFLGREFPLALCRQGWSVFEVYVWNALSNPATKVIDQLQAALLEPCKHSVVTRHVTAVYITAWMDRNS